MRNRLIRKLSLDFAMVLLTLLAFAYQLTGNTMHELIGLSMLVIFMAHIQLNRQWFVTLLKGKYPRRRQATVTINLLLLITMVVTIVSGLMSSNLLFSLGNIESILLPRELHTIAAYWFLVLTAMHLGMHWEMIMAKMRKMVFFHFYFTLIRTYYA